MRLVVYMTALLSAAGAAGAQEPTREFEIRDDRPYLAGQRIDIWGLRTGNALHSQAVTEHARMQATLFESGYRAVALSHHPLEDHFEGPQNKRRYDYWQWAMQVMTTYGPDINAALPAELSRRCESRELHAKVNYYGPALAAPSMASPFCRRCWRHMASIRSH